MARARKKQETNGTEQIEPRKIRKALQGAPQTNKELRASLGLSPDKYDPRLDRKLQQLRKDGEIHLVGSRWALNTIRLCPHCGGRGWVETKGKSGDTPAPPAH
jgi:hypothetical protein